MINLWITALLLAWLVIFIWAWGLFWKQRPRSYQAKELLTQEGDTQISYPPEFATSFRILYGVWWPLAFVLGLTVPFWMDRFQQYLFRDNETIAFASNMDLAFWFLMFLCLFLASFALAAKLIFRKKYPKFDEYQALRSKLAVTKAFKKLKSITQHRKVIEATVRYNEERVSENQFYGLIVLFLVAWAFIPSGAILAIDDYVRVTKEGAHINLFFSVLEHRVEWSQFVSAQISGESHIQCRGKAGCSGPYFRPHLLLETSGDGKYEVWGGMGKGAPSIDQVEEVISLLKKNSVSITVVPLQPSALDTLRSKSSAETQEKILNIFQENSQPVEVVLQSNE